jgi:hypothetical protein
VAVAAIVAFLLARGALLPGLGFWDTGEFQTVGPVLGTAHPTGFPAYVILGWLASIVLQPFGDAAFRMNLLSALLVGVAAGLTVVLARQLTGHTWVALAAGVVLAAIPIVWDIGTHADAHALHLVLVALLLIFLVGWESRVRAGAGPSADRWLTAAAVTFGVSIANHSLTLLMSPGIGLFVLATQPAIVRQPRRIGSLTLAILATAFLLYLELPLRGGLLRAPLVYGNPGTVSGFLYVVFAQQFTGAFYQPFGDLGGKAADLLRFGIDQLGVLVVLVPVGFLVTCLRKPRYALLTGVSFLVTVWFAASYENADIARYYLGPALIAVTWVAILGTTFVELLWEVMGAAVVDQRRGVLLTPSFESPWYGAPGAAALIIELAVAASLIVPTLVAVPERARNFDLSHETVATQWAESALAVMRPQAVVLSWWSYSTPLWYLQIVEGQRPDIWIVDDRTRLDDHLGELTDVIDAQLGKRPVYLVRLPETYDVAILAQRYELQEIAMPTEQSIQFVVGLRQ